MKKGKKWIAIVIALLLLLAIAAGGIWLGTKLGLITRHGGGNLDATFETDEYVDYGEIHDVSDADSLNELLKSWATNGGQKMQNKDVLNVLLLGEDKDNNSDAVMLASLDKKNKKITLVSFFRDSYSYMDIEGSERYDKMNHAFGWGGPEAVATILENNYKIAIDNYVTVDFSTFPTLIDALGGVKVDITEHEASWIRRKTKHKNIQAGEDVLLTGEQALMFSRIRYLDSDEERTRRQRDVISSIIHSTTDASVWQLNSAINQLLKNIKTDFSRTDLLSLGTQAITNGWMNYEMQSIEAVREDYRKGSYLKTYSSSARNPLFVWIVDYPLAAQEVQTALYGTSNITIDPLTHQSALDLLVKSPPRQYNTTTAVPDYADTTHSLPDFEETDTVVDSTVETTQEEPTTGGGGWWWQQPQTTTQPASTDALEDE